MRAVSSALANFALDKAFVHVDDFDSAPFQGNSFTFTLKELITSATAGIFFLFCFGFRLADDSYEMRSLTFSENKRKDRYKNVECRLLQLTQSFKG